ncbi:LysR family transcriptional regulator [Variovorax paradoxus]|uniref:LysR family transcriptional regulator n=1 Tax=Variovorax paradoxus TaxID=34073 RepID=A0A5Q0M6C1_VARPD|nr:LysR family transcriptional regulator [Variovorax paradoxus]QFZ84025.1 LysR family transcriptional regulator [Variovorax paradoxus]
MDLNAAQMFVAVVQAGSLSAAAQRMEIPLPTLSRRIRELERELKVQLLERSARGTSLTEAGMRLYEHASRGIEALAEGEQAVMSDQARLKGRLRLSLPPGFEPWWALLRAFQQQYPDIELSVYTTERRVDLVQDGIDVALRVGTIVHESMVARHMTTYRHVLVASPQLVQKLDKPTSPDDLHRFPCAVWCRDVSARGTWQLGDQTLEPRPVLSTNSYLHLRSLALAGEAVTELPPFLAAAGLQAGQLCALLPGHLLPEQQVHLLYPSHRHPSSIVRAYLDYCQSHLAHHLGVS